MSVSYYAPGTSKGNNRWCPWLRVQAFKQPKPKTRAASRGVASALLGAGPAGPKRLLLMWLFRIGTRISDTLRFAEMISI